MQGSGYIWLGGNVKKTGDDDREWTLLIYRLSESITSGTQSFQEYYIIYEKKGDGCGDGDGYQNDNTAPYISHLGLDTAASSAGVLFGVSKTNNMDGRPGYMPMVFRLDVDEG